MTQMITLGIETSCDETAAAILKDRKILSNVVSSSMHLHKKYGGIVPEIATRFHVEVINYCFREAIRQAKINLKDIDLISVTEGPGLIGALLVGISFAKALSYSLNVPLVGTNHIIAHLWANFLTANTPNFPFVGLAISGGHTSLIWMRDVDKYKVLGQTQDDAVGEAFDKVAKILNLGYPGGPVIEKTAKRSDISKRIKFSVSAYKDNSLDFSFSGIKTAVLYYVKNKGGLENLDRDEISEIACGFQEAVCDELVRKTILACKIKKTKDLVIGGGVSANMRLREKLSKEAVLNGIRIFIPPLDLCLDNAAMIAGLGCMLFEKGIKSDLYISGFSNFDN